MYFFFPPPQLFRALQTVRGEPGLSSLQSYRCVGVTPPGGCSSSGQEAEETKALLFSGQPETRGSHQVWNSAFSASYIMRLWGKSFPIPFSLTGWQQTSLKEDAFEHFFPKINFFQKGQEIKEIGRNRISSHAYTYVFLKHLSYCAQQQFQKHSSWKLLVQNQCSKEKSQVLHFCQFLQCLLLSCSILRSPDSCRSYSR